MSPTGNSDDAGDTSRHTLPDPQDLTKSVRGEIAHFFGGPRAKPQEAHRDPEGYGRLLLDLEKRILTSHFVEAGGTSISLSPDGRCIAAVTRKGHFRILDRQTKLALFQVEGTSQAFRDVSYSPDGRAIAAVSESGTLFVWKPWRAEKKK